MKWYTNSSERPRKRSPSESLPSSDSNRYSLSIRTQGSSCRRRASSSLRRVSSFSASSSSSLAASHSSRVAAVLCCVMRLSPLVASHRPMAATNRETAGTGERRSSSGCGLLVLAGRQPEPIGNRRLRAGGQRLPGLQQGLEAGEDGRPTLADHRRDDAAGLEAVVDDRQLDELAERLRLEADPRPLVGRDPP